MRDNRPDCDTEICENRATIKLNNERICPRCAEELDVQVRPEDLL